MPLFVDVRADTFLRGAGGVDLTLERAAAFREAGADGVFAPGAVDPETVKALVDGIDGPLNVMAGPGSPPVAELAALAIGAGVAQAAHAVVRRAARELPDTGTHASLAGGLDHAELNTLLGARCQGVL